MNTMLTISTITQEALKVLANNLTLVSNVNRSYDQLYVSGGNGYTVRIHGGPAYVRERPTRVDVDGEQLLVWRAKHSRRRARKRQPLLATGARAVAVGGLSA